MLARGVPLGIESRRPVSGRDCKEPPHEIRNCVSPRAARHHRRVRRLAGPKELHPPKGVVDIANDVAGRTGARVTITDDPRAAVKDVDFVHTDVWVSMGEAKDVWSERVRILTPYQVNRALLDANGNLRVKFMHCLPAFHDPNTTVGREIIEHTGMNEGLDVTGEVFESPASIVFDQAENRLHTIKAILVATLGS
jgi:ornithine carbamoyltransferase